MDPALASAIGLHHSLTTAIADLVDNSIDAEAAHIRVRFLLDGTSPIGLQILDDGSGMDSIAMDRAMTYSGARSHDAGELGHFGVGLKAASLSQADTILVCSRAHGAAPVGRKLVRSGDRAAPEVGELATGAVLQRLDGIELDFALTSGTVVEWRDVRFFPSTPDVDEQQRWLSEAVRDVLLHLGLVMHRLLDEMLEISVETLDIRSGAAGPIRDVAPIDPFDYPRSGAHDFPQVIVVRMPDGSEPVETEAHIWPASSQTPSFKLAGRPGADAQGFFVYRNGRLLQAGGWNGVRPERPDWGLARVKVELHASASRHVTINPEKSGVEFSDALRRAMELARLSPSGMSFVDYLEVASGQSRAARARERRPIVVTEPRSGMTANVLRAYADAVDFVDVAPVDIVWRTLDVDRVFHIDMDTRELALNLRYRRTLAGSESLDPEDGPVVKVLFHLLMEKHFQGSFLGARDKLEVQAWHALLLAAVHAQQMKETGS